MNDENHISYDGKTEIEQLKNQVNELKAEIVNLTKANTDLENCRTNLEQVERVLRDIENIAKIGGWEMDLEKGGAATWTKGTYDIIEIEYDKPIPGFEEHVSWYLPEYRQMIHQKMNDLANLAKPMHFEAQAKTKSGKIIWCQALGEAIKTDGKVVKLQGVFQDITARKHAEEEVRKNKILLEASIEAQVDIIIVLLDREFRYLYFNKTFSDEIYKAYKSKPKIGECIFDHITNADDIPKSKKHFQMALEGMGHKSVESFGAPNSRSIYESRYNPIFDSNKKIIGVTSFSKNVTEDVKKEHEIKRYSRIFENSINEIYLFGAEDLKFTQANNAALKNLGYSIEELKKLTPADLHVDTTYNRLQKLLMPLSLNESEEIVFEAVHRRKNGSFYDVEVHFQLIEFEKEKIYSAIVLDISPRKKIERELEKQRLILEDTVRERTEELLMKNAELDETLKVFVGRELTIRNLQKRISALEGHDQ